VVGKNEIQRCIKERKAVAAVCSFLSRKAFHRDATISPAYSWTILKCSFFVNEWKRKKEDGSLMTNAWYDGERCIPANNLWR